MSAYRRSKNSILSRLRYPLSSFPHTLLLLTLLQNSDIHVALFIHTFIIFGITMSNATPLSPSELGQTSEPVRNTVRDEDIDPALREIPGSHPPPPSQNPPPATHSSLSRESSPQAAPLAESNNTTWAARNPARPVLNPRPPPARLTDTQKASRAIAHEQKKANAKKLDDDIKAFLEQQQAKLNDIAKANNVKVEKVKDLVGAYTHYKQTRKPTLHNAILHVKAMEVNQGKLGWNFLCSILMELYTCRPSPWTEG